MKDSIGLRGQFALLRQLIDRPAKVQLIFLALASTALALIETTAIVAIVPLVELASGSNPNDTSAGWLWQGLGRPEPTVFGAVLATVVMGGFVVKDLLAMGFSWWQSGVLMRLRLRTQARLMKRFMYAPFVTHRTRSVADSIRTLNDAVGQVFGLILNSALGIFSAAVTVAMIVGALIVISPIPTLALLVYITIGALAYLRFVRPRVLAAGEIIVEQSTQGYLTALQALGAFKEIRLRRSEDFFISKYESAITEGASASRLAGFFGSIPRYYLEIFFITAVGALMLTAFASGSSDGIVATLALFVAAGFRILPNISMLLTGTNSIRLAERSLRDVHRETLTVTQTVEPQHCQADVDLRTALDVDDVWFRYPNSTTDVLRGITLSIPKGSSVAFVGGSGAGKTTLVDVILGLLPPNSGRVLADGVDIAECLPGWQAQTTMVAQDLYFSGWTLAENIAFDERPEDINGPRLDAAVERAQLADLVAEMPEGLNTMLWDGGMRLSGGQRQRAGIARALYRDPALLVLDEATSSLDNITERKITDTVTALHGEVTVIIVAHRLSTVRHVDQVVYLSHGQVEATGTFEEVVEQSAEFAELVRLGSLD